MNNVHGLMSNIGVDCARSLSSTYIDSEAETRLEAEVEPVAQLEKDHKKKHNGIKNRTEQETGQETE